MGYVCQHAAYHHGDVSLSATIVGLAQNYVGSNNINLLEPSGQFGTRLNVSVTGIEQQHEHSTVFVLHREAKILPVRGTCTPPRVL